MANRVTTKVKLRPEYQVAVELFRAKGMIALNAWNKTQKTAAAARRLAPYKTGALRRSIVARKSPKSTPVKPVYEVVAGEGLNHAAPQEFGFVHWRSGKFVPGKHYLRNAFRQVWG